MAKISEYRNYGENVPSGGSTAKFKETGVIPVSGKYTDNGDMETRNVPLSEVTVEQAQADWNETNTESKAYINNKPANIGKGIKAGTKITIRLDPEDGKYIISAT